MTLLTDKDALACEQTVVLASREADVVYNDRFDEGRMLNLIAANSFAGLFRVTQPSGGGKWRRTSDSPNESDKSDRRFSIDFPNYHLIIFLLKVGDFDIVVY